jgi:hypothetical protein
MATQSQTKCGETQETKVGLLERRSAREDDAQPVSASNGDNVTGLSCKVSIRIIDFNTSRGVGCHQHAMGHGWERYMDTQALPILRKQAARFLNWDLNTRVMAPFSTSTAPATATARSSPTASSGSPTSTRCRQQRGARVRHRGHVGRLRQRALLREHDGTYSYDANTPDPMVLSSCEHYGMHDGANGKDMTTPYTNKMTDDSRQRAAAGPCTSGSHLLLDRGRLRRPRHVVPVPELPSYGTTAKNDDGTPMHNWWPYLFY